ncbi:MAG: beta-N-acetylhexosaminidase [Gemmatimonadetes bacterium]|nr:beta-N-acetylhexosaminidase [Gemmatimonadota bacterium]
MVMRVGRAIRCTTLGALTIAVAACAAARPMSTGHAITVRGTTSDIAWADSVLTTLSLRDKAAQMVWPWILGDYTATDNAAWTRVEKMVREQKLGGAIISVGGPIDIAVKTNALQRSATLPLLIGADLETGAAFRARGGYFIPNAIDLGGATAFPYQMGIGATRDTVLAYEMGRVTAIEGRALGIQMAFAPVLDVNNNPKNPVIAARSFGEDPRLVAQMGRSFIRGIQENGMLATAKHFPGHGDTEQNSHLELARVDASRARLDSVELLPFREAVKSGVAGVMTFHGYLPALDTTRTAATLSPKVMLDLLRTQMGFQGILVTDALDMNGVLGNATMGEVTQLAVAAGNDVLLMPTDVNAAIDAVVSGVRAGRFTEARVDSSVRRLLVAKHRMGLDRNRYVDVEKVRSIVADSANLAPARVAAERAITLVHDSLGMIPLGRLPRTSRVVSLTIAPRAELSAGATFNAELQRQFPQLRTQVMTPEIVFDATAGAASGGTGTYVASPVPRLLPAIVDNAMHAAEGADVVIVSSYFGASTSTATMSATGGLPELIDGLQKAGRKVILVSFANPYLPQGLPATPVFLEAWSASALSQRAAARALVGLAPITGQLPITIPSVAPYGAGLRREALPVLTP